MTLPVFTVMLLGICVELFTLWEQRSLWEPRNTRESNDPSPQLGPYAFGATMSPARLLITAFTVLALLLLELYRLAGWESHEVYLGQLLPDILFGALALAVLFFGLLSPTLLPAVDEVTVLATHVTVVLTFVLNQPVLRLTPASLVVGIITLPLLWVGLSRRTLAPTGKAMLYLWYLVTLLALTLQHDFSAFTEPIVEPLPLLEAFTAGATGIFLLLHSLFLLRFALIASSLIVPQNRRYIAHIMPRLVGDRRIPRWQIIGIPALTIALLLANTRLGILDTRTLAGALILLLAQAIPALNTPLP